MLSQSQRATILELHAQGVKKREIARLLSISRLSVRKVLRSFEAYMNDKQTWAHQHAPELRARPVAYFSAEFGFHETSPIAIHDPGRDAPTRVSTPRMPVPSHPRPARSNSCGRIGRVAC